MISNKALAQLKQAIDNILDEMGYAHSKSNVYGQIREITFSATPTCGCSYCCSRQAAYSLIASTDAAFRFQVPEPPKAAA